MITIDTATTDNTVSYYYNIDQDVFLTTDWRADLTIIVDAGLTAQEVDVLINKAIDILSDMLDEAAVEEAIEEKHGETLH